MRTRTNTQATVKSITSIIMTASRLWQATAVAITIFALSTATLPAVTNWVSVAGDDSTGDGSTGSPYRSITKALSTPSINLISVGSGTYDVANGETFPLAIPDGIKIIADSAILNPNYTTNALLLASGATSGNLISGLRIERAKGPAIRAGSWGGTIKDCTITDVANSAVLDNNDTAVLYHTGEDSRTIILDNLVVTNITTADRHIIWFYGGPDGVVVMTNCVFRDIEITTAIGDRKGGPIGFMGTSHATGYTVTIVDSVFENLSCAGQQYAETSYVDCWYKPLMVDRCEFRNVVTTNGNNRMNIVGGNRNTADVANTLFAGCNAGSDRACIGGFRDPVNIRNCTFDEVSAPFLPSLGYIMQAYNSSISHSDRISPANGIDLLLYNVNIFDTPDGNGYSLAGSDITKLEPYYEDRAGGDYRLHAFSPLVDLGLNANVEGTEDAVGNMRIRDGNADGTATVDIGAYEVNFLNPANPRFSTSKPSYAMFGGARSFDVFINPSAAGAADAAIAFGTDLSGLSTLSFASGSSTSSLSVTVSQPLTVSNGTISVISLSETNTSLGVEPGEIGIYLYDSVVTVGGSRQMFRASTTNEVHVEFSDSALQAPGAITVTTGSIGGSGNNQISWVGGNTIPDGGSQSEGYLRIIGGSGENTVQLTVDNGFAFKESDASSVTLTIVGYTSPLHVSTTGNNSTGDGTLGNPMATMAHAATLLEAGDEIRLAAGTYGTVSGETFPILPGALNIVGNGSVPGDCIIDGDSADDILFNFSFFGTSVTGSLQRLTITGQTKNGLIMDDSAMVLSNCVFRNTSAGTDKNNGDPVGVYMQNDSKLTVQDCTFSNLNSRGIIGIENAVQNTDNNVVIENCSFVDNTLSVAPLYAEGSIDGRFWISDTLFMSNNVPDDSVHDAWPSPVIYLWASDGVSVLEMDRCRVIGNSGGNVLAPNRLPQGAGKARNCLFVDNATDAGFLRSYSGGMDFINCTFSGNEGTFVSNNPNQGINLKNCIVEDHTGDLGDLDKGIYLTLYNTMTWNATLGTYNAAGSTNVYLGVNPALKSDYDIEITSPAANIGNNDWVNELVDLNGNPRIMFNIVDLGAFEAQKPAGTLLIIR